MADLRTSEISEVPGLEGQAQEALADWKPDGSAIVVARRGADSESSRGRQLYLMDPATGVATPLVADGDYDHSYFAWDPSGDTLLLERSLALGGQPPGEQQIRSQVWTYNATSGALQLVAANAYQPRWVP
jgi:Tol biopolymer transport system component